LQLVDPLVIDPTVSALRSQLPEQWRIVDWREDFGELFRAVRLEKGMMFLLLLLIVAVAAFNIVSAQTMLVHERRADIAILRTMGATSGLILRMVLVQGLSIAALGIGLGVALGVVLAYNVTEAVAALEQLFDARLLDAFYLDELPARIMASDIVTISLMSLGLCLVSALLPARRAAALHPADALHGG
jgi:lipoprotein-releasing system permease protein